MAFTSIISLVLVAIKSLWFIFFISFLSPFSFVFLILCWINSKPRACWPLQRFQPTLHSRSQVLNAIQEGTSLYRELKSIMVIFSTICILTSWLLKCNANFCVIYLKFHITSCYLFLLICLKHSSFLLADTEPFAFVRILDAFSLLLIAMQLDIWLICKSGLVSFSLPIFHFKKVHLVSNFDSFPHNVSIWISGAGCMVAAICGSTQKEPIVVGKPSPFLMDFLVQK